MGGCFSLPDPATNGQPPQPDAAPVAKSLCQSIRDFFKKVKTIRVIHPTVSEKPQAEEDLIQYDWDTHPTVSEKPQAEEDLIQYNRDNHATVSEKPQAEEDLIQYPHYRRSHSLGGIEKKQKELRDAELLKAIRRCNLDLDALKSRNEQDIRRLIEINLILSQKRHKILSNPVDETKTCPEEKLTNIREVTTTRDNKKETSALNQFEFGEPRVVRETGTEDSSVDKKTEHPSSSITVKIWSTLN